MVDGSTLPGSSASRGSRKGLLVALLIAAIAVLGYFMLRGTGSSPVAAGVHVGKHKHHPPTKSSRGGAVQHSSHSGVRVRRRSKKHRRTADEAAYHRYVLAIRPVIEQSAVVFDRSVIAAAANPSGDPLFHACEAAGGQVNVLAGQFSGIPSQWPYWYRKGHLHESITRVYNYMLGAIQNCQTAGSSGDGAAAAQAIADMGSAARDMHRDVAYVGWLAKHT